MSFLTKGYGLSVNVQTNLRRKKTQDYVTNLLSHIVLLDRDAVV